MPRPLRPETTSQDYVDGKCHYFALALHKLTGQPILEVGKLDADGHFQGGHFVLDVGNGKVADATGVHPLEDLLDSWQSTSTQRVFPQSLASELARDPDDEDPTDMTADVMIEINRAKAAIEADQDFHDEVDMAVLGSALSPRH